MVQGPISHLNFRLVTANEDGLDGIRRFTCLFAYSMAASNSRPSHISRGRFSLRLTRFSTTSGLP